MATKQYQYNPEYGDNAISEVGTDDIVLYVDDINKEVVAKVVELHNKGKSIQDIQKILDKDERVTLDEADFIVEQLIAYEKLSEGSGTQYSNENTETVTIPVEADGTVTIGNVTYTASPGVIEVKMQVPVQDKPQTRGEKAAATRKANEGAKKTGTGGKAVSAASVIDKLKAQTERAEKLILLVGYVDQLDTSTPFPEGLVKDQIELLVKFTREVEKLKGEYINQIQEL